MIEACLTGMRMKIGTVKRKGMKEREREREGKIGEGEEWAKRKKANKTRIIIE